MTWRSLLSAVGLWMLRPGSLFLANFFAFPLVSVGLWIAWSQPQNGRPLVGLFGFLLAWLTFNLLVRSVYAFSHGATLKRLPVRELLRDAFWPRVLLGTGCYSTSTGILLWLFKAMSPQGQGFSWGLALLLAVWLWIFLATLISAGLDAPLDQPAWAAQKAALMAVPAFLISAVGLGTLLTWLTGSWMLWTGPNKFWGAVAALPLLAAPVFSISTFAGVILFFGQGVKDRSRDKEALANAPTLKDLIRPWH